MAKSTPRIIIRLSPAKAPKRAFSATPDLPSSKRYWETSFAMHSSINIPHKSSGWACVNQPKPKPHRVQSHIHLSSASPNSLQIRSTAETAEDRIPSATKDQGANLGFTEEELDAVSNHVRVLFKANQVRTIYLWMKMNTARSIGHHLDAFEDLLETLRFKNPGYTQHLRARLRRKVVDKVHREGTRMQECGAITVFNMNTKDEYTIYSDWTDAWLLEDWDGSFEEPVDEGSKFDGEESEADAVHQLEGHAGRKCSTLEAERLEVEEPEVGRVYIQNSESAHQAHSTPLFPDAYTDDDSRTRHDGGAEIRGGEVENREEEYSNSEERVHESSNRQSQATPDLGHNLIQSIPAGSLYVSPYSGPWSKVGSKKNYDADGEQDHERGEIFDKDGRDEERGRENPEHDVEEEHGGDGLSGDERAGKKLAEEREGEFHEERASLKPGLTPKLKLNLSVRDTASLMAAKFAAKLMRNLPEDKVEDDGGEKEIIDGRWEYEDDGGVLVHGGAILL